MKGYLGRKSDLALTGIPMILGDLWLLQYGRVCLAGTPSVLSPDALRPVGSDLLAHLPLRYLNVIKLVRQELRTHSSLRKAVFPLSFSRELGIPVAIFY